MPKNTSMTLGEHFDGFIANQIALPRQVKLCEQRLECLRITKEK